MSRKRKHVKNQNQLELLAEIRKSKGKSKRRKKNRNDTSNIDYLFWVIAQDRKRSRGQSVVHG